MRYEAVRTPSLPVSPDKSVACSGSLLCDEVEGRVKPTDTDARNALEFLAFFFVNRASHVIEGLPLPPPLPAEPVREAHHAGEATRMARARPPQRRWWALTLPSANQFNSDYSSA